MPIRGCRRRISWAASMPSMWWSGGMRMSVMTTSGCELVDAVAAARRPVDGGDHLELAPELQDGADAFAVRPCCPRRSPPATSRSNSRGERQLGYHVVPPVGCASTVTVPPSAAARSAMFVSPPTHGVVADPTTVVATRIASRSPSTARCTRHRRRVGVLDDVGERLGHDEVDGALDRLAKRRPRISGSRPIVTSSGSRLARASIASTMPWSSSIDGWIPWAMARRSSSA